MDGFANEMNDCNPVRAPSSHFHSIPFHPRAMGNASPLPRMMVMIMVMVMGEVLTCGWISFDGLDGNGLMEIGQSPFATSIPGRGMDASPLPRMMMMIMVMMMVMGGRCCSPADGWMDELMQLQSRLERIRSNPSPLPLDPRAMGNGWMDASPLPRMMGAAHLGGGVSQALKALLDDDDDEEEDNNNNMVVMMVMRMMMVMVMRRMIIIWGEGG